MRVVLIHTPTKAFREFDVDDEKKLKQKVNENLAELDNTTQSMYSKDYIVVLVKERMSQVLSVQEFYE